MITVYVYLFLGMLAYFLIDFATFCKSVPGIYGKLAKLKQYLDTNILFMAAGLLLGLVLVSLADIGSLPFLSDIGFPLKQSPESAVILGLLNQWIVIKIRKWKRSLLVETRNDEVVKAEQF
mgnify:CR=1 FL=1